MVYLKVEDAVKVMGVMAIDCLRLWYYFQGMNDYWKTVRQGRNYDGVNLYFPERLQEGPYWNPDFGLLA